MKRILEPLTLAALALLALTLTALAQSGGTVKSVNDTNELVMLNPRSANTNVLVHAMPWLSSSFWTWHEGDATPADTNHLDSVLYPGLGRWVWNNIGTNYFQTLVVSNFVGAGDSLWTNLGGILQPQNLTLPVMITNQLQFGPGTTNVLFRQGSNLAYTNSNTVVGILVKNGSGDTATLEVDGGGHTEVQAEAGHNVNLSIAGANNLTWTGSILQGPTGVDQLGAPGVLWDNSYFGTGYFYGYDNGANYSRLKIYQTDTNSPVIFDLQSFGSGINGATNGFSFRTNGVNVIGIDGGPTGEGELLFGVGGTNVLYRSGSDFYLTNGAATPRLFIVNGSGNYATFTVSNNGGATMNAMAGRVARVGDANDGVQYLLNHWVPITDGASSLGSLTSSSRWKDLAMRGTNFFFGHESDGTNFLRGDIKHTGIGGKWVFDSQSGGTNTPVGFSFRTNGVEVFNVTGTGGPSSGANWVASGTTDSTLAGTANAAELYTGSFKLYRGALTPVDAGVSLDFGSTNRYWSITLTGNVTFATANLAAGKHANIMITGVATNAAYTWPAGWIFIGYKPTYLTANKHADLYLKSTSGADAGVWAYYGEEQ